MIFTIKVNGKSILVEKDTVSEAICCAVESYVTGLAEGQDACTLNLDTMPISVQTCGVVESIETCEEEPVV